MRFNNPELAEYKAERDEIIELLEKALASWVDPDSNLHHMAKEFLQGHTHSSIATGPSSSPKPDYSKDGKNTTPRVDNLKKETVNKVNNNQLAIRNSEAAMDEVRSSENTRDQFEYDFVEG